MDIPNLPTDSAYKLLAVSVLFLSVACFVCAFILMDRIAARESEMGAKWLDHPDDLRAALALKPDAKIPDLIKVLSNTQFEPMKVEMHAAYWLGLFGVIFQLIFTVAMWLWIRLQRLNDAIAALDLAERFKGFGVKVVVKGPKIFHV